MVVQVRHERKACKPGVLSHLNLRFKVDSCDGVRGAHPSCASCAKSKKPIGWQSIMPVHLWRPSLMPDHPPSEQQRLRRELRQRRHQLPAALRAQLSTKIQRLALRQLRFQHSHTVGAYWTTSVEVDIKPLLMALHAQGIRIALPALVRHRPGAMIFRRWHPNRRQCSNRFQISEPCHRTQRIWRRELDWVLVPLVGFDAQGYRLGMGGGYYDRYFARRRWGQRRPRLIGIAFSVQELETLPHQPWDISMDAIITEHGWREFAPPQAP